MHSLRYGHIHTNMHLHILTLSAYFCLNTVQDSGVPCLSSSPDLLFVVPLYFLVPYGSSAEVDAFSWNNYFAESQLFRINL